MKAPIVCWHRLPHYEMELNECKAPLEHTSVQHVIADSMVKGLLILQYKGYGAICI